MKTLTFLETLHPEKAATLLLVDDDTQSVAEAAPWQTVYHHSVSGTPIAVAEELKDEHQGVPVTTVEWTPDPPPASAPTAPAASSSTTHPNQEEKSSRRRMGLGCLGLEGLFGLTITLCAVITSILNEIIAIVFYFLAAGLYTMLPSKRQEQESNSVLQTSILSPILFLLIQTFLFVDAIILTSTIFKVELIALIAYLITTIFQGDGKQWWDYVRKTCHLVRWAFRTSLMGEGGGGKTKNNNGNSKNQKSKSAWKLKRGIGIQLDQDPTEKDTGDTAISNTHSTTETEMTGSSSQPFQNKPPYPATTGIAQAKLPVQEIDPESIVFVEPFAAPANYGSNGHQHEQEEENGMRPPYFGPRK